MPIYRNSKKVAISGDDLQLMLTDRVDKTSTEYIDNKIQANAVITVDTLPTANIKKNSLYQYTEDISYVLEKWERHGEDIDRPLRFFKSISEYLEINSESAVYHNDVAGDTDWPYTDSSIDWASFTNVHLEYFFGKNLVAECPENESTFCEYEEGKYDWMNDGSSPQTNGVCYSAETKSFSMTKIFKMVNDAWESISTIELSQEEYDNLPIELQDDGTTYIVEDSIDDGIPLSYDILADKPKINGLQLQGSIGLDDLGVYSRTEVNALLENKGQVEFVDALPVEPTTNTWYYSKKFEDGTDVPNDKRCLYIVDEDTTVYHDMGIVGDVEIETGDTLGGSEHLVTSSQVVKKEMSTKVTKYGSQVNVETTVNDATLWNMLAQINTDDKKTDSSMVFNAGTCYLIYSVSPTKAAQIFQFIVTGGAGASSINKKITLIDTLTGAVFTKTMDGGVWQDWKGGKKYKHTLVRYNNDSFEYPMGWMSVINNKKTMTYNDFRDWLNTNGYTTATNSYYWCGGCCGTTGVRNKEDTGTTYIGRVASGVFYDGTNMFFKYDYNGTVTILSSRCKVYTEELN